MRDLVVAMNPIAKSCVDVWVRWEWGTSQILRWTSTRSRTAMTLRECCATKRPPSAICDGPRLPSSGYNVVAKEESALPGVTLRLAG